MKDVYKRQRENYVYDGRLDLVTAALKAMDIKQGCEVYLQCDAPPGSEMCIRDSDMGIIIKYCDKVVLLHKGEFIAEGPAGKVVDMYKKILEMCIRDRVYPL